MTPDLECWLQQATRSLSKDSAAQVRTEIQEHYQSAREDAISGGASQDEANRMALIALGDAKTANKQYLRVLLMASESGTLSKTWWLLAFRYTRLPAHACSASSGGSYRLGCCCWPLAPAQ